ncbi:MAG TPA: hypothetical protein PKU85_01615, partial [Bacteroidales bacterium]|nr:hypothetical protein [Bacteroidales bacterium]
MNGDVVNKAREFAVQRLEGLTRGNGQPFMHHVDAVAAIVDREIGLPREAVVTVYLHEASRKDHG